MVSAWLIALAGIPGAGAASTWEGLTFYIGDPHVHSGVSEDGWSSDLDDGCGSHRLCGAFADLLATASANDLDWVGFSDHVNGPASAADETEWNALLAMVTSHDSADGLVVLPAAEVWFDTLENELGHKNLLFFGDDATLSAATMSDMSVTGGEQSLIDGCGDIATWMTGLEAAYGPALLIPHHPALRSPMPTDWTCHHPTWETGVEVYSHFGNSLGGHISADPPLGPVAPSGYVHKAMSPSGGSLRMAFFGGSDFHGSLPGTLCTEASDRHYGGGAFTVAWLSEEETWSRTSLYEALLARHTYATTGPLLPLIVRYTAVSVEAGPGDAVSIPGGERLTVTVELDPMQDDAVETVWLEGPNEAREMTDEGEGVWTIEVTADETLSWVYPVVQLDGPAWFGGDWCDDAGKDDLDWIWVTPTWFELADHDDDGDGVSWADGDCDDDDATIHPGAPEIWYDTVDEDCAGDSDFDQDGDGSQVVYDCDDTDASTYPGAEETWYDGLDQDCAGDDDFDQDADGYGEGSDCDDENAHIHPGAPERWYDGLDSDCAGGDDFDRDGDGNRAIPFGTDCNDQRAAVHPGAVERWYDGVDQDCGRDDDYDRDGDGHRPVRLGGDDCSDVDAARSPDATEVWYDGIDQDCDGQNDFDQDADGARAIPWGIDADDTDPAVVRP